MSQSGSACISLNLISVLDLNVSFNETYEDFNAFEQLNTLKSENKKQNEGTVKMSPPVKSP